MALYDQQSPMVEKEFNVARGRAKQQVGAGVQQKRDVLARRQAQLGGGPGGAFIRAEQGAVEEGQAQMANAEEGINAAQSAELRRIRELEGAQQFATGEREAAQTFARGEREATQGWQQGNINKDSEFRLKQFGLEDRKYKSGLKQFDRTFKQAQGKLNFDQEQASKEFAATMANNFVTQVGNMWAHKIPKSEIEGLMAKIGIVKGRSGDWEFDSPNNIFGGVNEDPLGERVMDPVTYAQGTKSQKGVQVKTTTPSRDVRKIYLDERGIAYTVDAQGYRKDVER